MALQTTFELEQNALPVHTRTELKLFDGAITTVHAVRYARTAFTPQLIHFTEPTELLAWCEENGHQEAINGGFFLRDAGKLLGEVCVGGETLPHEPFPGEYGLLRPGVYVDVHGNLELKRRKELPKVIDGDYLQAGPMLVHQKSVTHLSDRSDPEQFSLTAHQHDADITGDRYPRAAIGCNNQFIWTVTADGRLEGKDSGLYLHELAHFMKDLGVEYALNLDGGSSSTHVSGGELINMPRTDDKKHTTTGYPVYNGLVFVPRTSPPELRLVK